MSAPGAPGERGSAGVAEAAGGARATLLAIGDVHLGTRPSRLPPELADQGVDPAELTPEAALRAAVERAVAERVDAVLFAGDVVESTNARFEALRPLEAAVRRLAEAGIPVLAVAGNHDVEALPRLARMIEGFRLLGEGGRWEAHAIAPDGEPVAEIVGWSFPERVVRHSPVAELLGAPLPPAAPGVARLGLLHADLDARDGTYAPVAASELARARLDAWLLGHIHAPSLAPGPEGVPRGYLGSLVGLDPTEVGRHGPWRIRILPGRRVETEPLGGAPLRWERLDLEPPEEAGPEDVGDLVLEAAARKAREIAAAEAAPRALGVRVRLVGRTRHHAALRGWVEEESAWRGRLVREVAGTVVFVEKVESALALAVDLEELARGDDPPALLARKLLVLEREGEERRALLAAAREALRPAATSATFAPVTALGPQAASRHERRPEDDPLRDEALADFLRASGTAALDALLAQRGGRGAGGEAS